MSRYRTFPQLIWIYHKCTLNPLLPTNVLIFNWTSHSSLKSSLNHCPYQLMSDTSIHYSIDVIRTKRVARILWIPQTLKLSIYFRALSFNLFIEGLNDYWCWVLSVTTNIHIANICLCTLVHSGISYWILYPFQHYLYFEMSFEFLSIVQNTQYFLTISMAPVYNIGPTNCLICSWSNYSLILLHHCKNSI